MPGSVHAPSAVRRALAPNPGFSTLIELVCALNANDEGVVGCARGGRAPFLSQDSDNLIHFTLAQKFLVGGAGVIVGGFGLFLFLRLDQLLLLRPALIDAF